MFSSRISFPSFNLHLTHWHCLGAVPVWSTERSTRTSGCYINVVDPTRGPGLPILLSRHSHVWLCYTVHSKSNWIETPTNKSQYPYAHAVIFFLRKVIEFEGFFCADRNLNPVESWQRKMITLNSNITALFLVWSTVVSVVSLS